MPDAEPRIDPVRIGGPNKPYEVLGQSYVPLMGDPGLTESGLASWYGAKFHGRPTSNGETYDMYAMTAAHKTMPLPSYARVRNPANGREVVLRINDRGPFHPDRIIDLSYTAALKLDLLRGVAPVEVERITNMAIRSGSWRRPAVDSAWAAASPPADGEGDPIGEFARRSAQGVDAAAPALPSARGVVVTAADGFAPPPTGYWLQFGAFRDVAAADGLRQRLARQVDWLAPWLAVFTAPDWHRVQAGPYPSRPEAQMAADRLREQLAITSVLQDRR